MAEALIIEDDQDASDILADLARHKGFETLQCATGEDGLSAARRRLPAVVFLDLMLPDLDGFKICESLKLDRDTNRIPVIMVTALSAEESRVRGFRVGADAYLTKPYTPDELDQAISTALATRCRLEEEGVEHYVSIDLSSGMGNLVSVNELVGMLLCHTKLTEKEIYRIRQAVQEMGANAIEWGNKNEANKLVTIQVHLAHDRVEICIADEGEGFDRANMPHAFDGGEDPTQHMVVREMLGLREGGFGITMANGLVDEIRYNDKGNQVTLVKRIHS